MADDTTKRIPNETPARKPINAPDYNSWLAWLNQATKALSKVTQPKESDTVNKFKDNAQSAVEYALILVLTAVVIIAILTLLGPAIGNVFSNIVEAL